MRIFVLALLALAACEERDQPDQPDPREGIAVGNPPGMALLRGAPASSRGVTFTTLSFVVSQLYLEDCQGLGKTEESSGTLDLIGDDPVEIPAGTWCAMGFGSDEPVGLAGQVSNGGTFRFSAELGRLMVYGEVEVPEADEDATDELTTELVLELGATDFVREEDLGLEPTDDLPLGADCLSDPICAAIWTGLMHGSAVYEDGDGDGEVSDAERAEGARAQGTERPE